MRKKPPAAVPKNRSDEQIDLTEPDRPVRPERPRATSDQASEKALVASGLLLRQALLEQDRAAS